MAIVVVQHRAVVSSTFSFASTPTNGNAIIIAAGNNAGSDLPAAPVGQGFSGVTVGPNVAVAGTNDYAAIFWKRWLTGAGNSFPVGNMGGIAATYGWEVSGLTTGTLAAYLSSNAGTATGTAMAVPTAGAVPTNDSFAVSVMAANALFNTPAVTGFGDVVKAANPVAVAWETFTTQQTDVSAAWSWTTAVTPVGAIVVFQGTDPATPTPGTSLPMFLNVDGDWVPAVENVNVGGSWV